MGYAGGDNQARSEYFFLFLFSGNDLLYSIQNVFLTKNEKLF